MKKLIAFASLLLLVAAFLVSGCGSDNVSNKKVAISFANSSASWQKNGNSVKEALENEGFHVDLQFADTDEQQIEQIKKMIQDHPGCLVIGAVNGEKLTEILKDAKTENIPVIAYDRLIMNTDALSYYASFDNEAVGKAMSEYLVAALNLKSGAGPYNIEVFAGDPKDNNAHMFFTGSMEVLKPYFDNGQLVSRSNETSFEKAATKDWDGKNAQARMDKLISTYYADGNLAAVLAPNDGCAAGIRASLQANYHGAWPLITGQDAEASTIEAIRAGTQAITIYKSSDDLNAKCIRMIKAVVEGTQPAINDKTTYNNGVMTVPAYLCIPMIIDKDNTNLVK